MRCGAAVAERTAWAASQLRLLAGLVRQRLADLVLQGGELRAVVRADDAGVRCRAVGFVPNQVGDPSVRTEAVAARLLDLGVQAGQPRPPPDGEQQVAAGGEDAQRAGASFPDYQRAARIEKTPCLPHVSSNP